MRQFLAAALISMVTISSGAFAASTVESSKGPVKNVLGYLGVSRGGVTIGGGFEFLADGSQGMGGQLHYYQKNDTTEHGTPGFLILGGFTSYHFYKSTWDFALSPGFNIMQVNAVGKADDETDLGPSIQISLTQALNDKFAIGFDFATYYFWTGDARGLPLTDLDIKFKFAL